MTAPLTPVEALARLAQDPGDPPTGLYRLDHPECLGSVVTGDNIAIAGRWWRVVSTVGVNDRVDIEYLGLDETRPDPLVGSPRTLSGHRSTPVILAHICCRPRTQRPAATLPLAIHRHQGQTARMNSERPAPVRVEKAGAVTTVVLHRPEVRNAVDPETAALLLAAFQDFENDPEANVAVLYGDGGTFCAGFDLKALTAGAVPAGMAEYGDGPMGPSRLRLSKPVVAAVAGHAVAGGLELALWCDLRVVEESAVFGVFCRRWGVPLVDGGTVRLPRLIGQSRAMDMILTGRPVPASEALAWGLANRVVADGTVRAAAESLAAEIAALPQLCLREDRLSALEQDGLGEEEALRNELRHGQRSLAESLAGAQRFAEGAGRHGAAAD